MNRLTSYFTFLRAEQSKREDYLFFTTLVHDLTSRYPSFKTALGKVIRDNKRLRTAQDYHTLFEYLLLQPLRDVHIFGPIFIIIDALDESGDANDRNGFHSFLAKHLAEFPSNVRILITSRPDIGIMRSFSDTSQTFQILYIDGSEQAARTDDDIRLYLQKNLPPNTFIQYGDQLAKKADGSFQWAAMACGFIRSPPPGRTKTDRIHGLLDLSGGNEVGELYQVYNLYRRILDGYFKADIVRRRFQSVVGQLLAAFEPLSILSLTTLRHFALGGRDDDDSVIAIVRNLGSLLSNVTSTDETLPIVPLHGSFRDFLTDAEMSGDFYIDLGEAHHQLAHSCLRLLIHNLKFNICNLETSYFPNDSIFDLQSCINKHISPALFYACRFWDGHLGRVNFEQDLVAKVQFLFEQKFLFWLEVLSLTSTVGLAAPALRSLEAWLASGDHRDGGLKTFQELVNDGSTFLRYFGMTIAKSAPHIYISALPFVPTSSYIFWFYSQMFPNTLRVERGQLTNWPAMEMEIYAGEEITSVAFSQDGQWIISGLRDDTICVWNATTGMMEGDPLTGHTDWVESVAFSPDGQWIVSGSHDHTICVWNATTGVMVGVPLTGHTGWVNSVAFSPDGQKIISGSSDYTICVWNATAGVMEGVPLTGHTDWVNSVAFSPDGQQIVSGSRDCTICVWNAKMGTMEGISLTGHTGSVSSVAFSPDGQWIVSGSQDCTICVWNAITGVMKGDPLIGHTEWVTSVAFSPDGRRIVSGSGDHTICVWNAITGVMEGVPLTGHTNWVNSAAFSMDGQRIVSGSSDRTIHVWNATLGSMEGVPLTGHTQADWVNSVAFSEDGQWIVSGLQDCMIRVWNAKTGMMKGDPLIGHTSWVSSVAFSHDGKWVVSGSHDCTICVWNAITGVMEGVPMTGHTEWVSSVAFSQDGQQIVSGSGDHTICVWNATTRAIEGAPLTRHTGCVDSVGFSQDGLQIVSGSRDCTICVWNATTGVLKGVPLTGHSSWVNSVVFSKDGQKIVSGSDDYTIRMWNAITGVMERIISTEHIGSVNSVALSQDGQWIVSGLQDHTIRVWNATTGIMEGVPLTGHTEWVNSVAFSQDGEQIVSGSCDGTIRVWKATMGVKEGVPLTGHTNQVHPVAFLQAEQQIVSGSSERMIHAWATNDSEAATDMATQVDFTDQSIVNSEGWICGPRGELLVYIPHIYRTSLYRPSNIWISGAHPTSLDLSCFVHGQNWAACFSPGTLG